jgi:hypothetical protein
MAALRLKGSGWSCAIDEADILSLTERLQLTGRWSLAVGITDRIRVGITEMALSKDQKRNLLATLKGMRETQVLSDVLRRMTDDLESDLSGYDYCY